MKAIAFAPDSGELKIVERPEPAIVAPGDVKLRTIRVGICGTDREQLHWGRRPIPEGQSDMVIGHESFGQVVAASSDVARVSKGDYGVFTVRRGCGRCLPCQTNRSDMCQTGDYRERGIWRADGYQAEYVVDDEQYLVRVPPALEAVGVLVEPLSVVEKAIDQALRVQATRLSDAPATADGLAGRRCLVTGLGPIGLLAAMILRLRGAHVHGMDIVDETTPRPRWLAHIGGRYIDGRVVRADQVSSQFGDMDLVIEASGGPGMAFSVAQSLARNGVCVIIGVPGDRRSSPIAAGDLVLRMVVGNQAIIGVVNAARVHFQMAVDDLERARLAWGDHAARLITHRRPYTDIAAALAQHTPDEIKTVIEWNHDIGRTS